MSFNVTFDKTKKNVLTNTPPRYIIKPKKQPGSHSSVLRVGCICLYPIPDADNADAGSFYIAMRILYSVADCIFPHHNDAFFYFYEHGEMIV